MAEMGDKSSVRVTSLRWQSNVVNPSLKFLQDVSEHSASRFFFFL
jgi:hypothetical protein